MKKHEQQRRGSLYYEIVWLVNNMSHRFPKKIHKVRNTFWQRAYHLATAKVWVYNSRKAYGTAKRKNQVYFQIWHAGLGFKPIGKFRGERLLYPEMLLYEGEIWETGSPRCDVLVTGREEKYREIRQRYHIPEDGKIAMYAPTFRVGSQKGRRQVFVEEPTLDFQALEEALRKRFGGDWYVLLRLHPQVALFCGREQ